MAPKNAARNLANLHECSITIVGFWNRMIFTPKWVAERVFKDTDRVVKAKVPLMPADPIVYTDSKVTLNVSASQLVFTVGLINESWVKQAGEMAYRVLDELDDTPIRALIVNFSFGGFALPKHLTTIFSEIDKLRFDRLGWNLEADRIVRQVSRDHYELSVMIARAKHEATADVFFHFNLGVDLGVNNALAAKALHENVLGYRDDAIRMLKRVYQIELGPKS